MPFVVPPTAIPDEYLRAIGRLMVNWSQLEGIMNLVLIKMMGATVTDSRAHVVFAQMSFQDKMNCLQATANIYGERLEDADAHAKFSKSTFPKLADLQAKRNIYAHCNWHIKDGVVSRARLTARGKLKIATVPVTLVEIEKTAEDILSLAGEVWGMVRFSEFDEVDPK